MVQYQSIPTVNPHANAEQEDMVKIHKSVMVRRISGAVLILFIGLGVVATTHTYRSGKSIIAGTTAATALLRSTTTTTVDNNHGPNDDRYVTLPDDDASVGGDHCCAPATGTWTGWNNGDDDDGGNGVTDGPFETCWYNCDYTALKALDSSCYCWSKSYYDGVWNSCTPLGGRPWQEYTIYTIRDMYPDQPDSDHENENRSFCGTPCQDFEKGYVPICPI